MINRRHLLMLAGNAGTLTLVGPAIGRTGPTEIVGQGGGSLIGFDDRQQTMRDLQLADSVNGICTRKFFSQTSIDAVKAAPDDAARADRLRHLLEVQMGEELRAAARQFGLDGFGSKDDGALLLGVTVFAHECADYGSPRRGDGAWHELLRSPHLECRSVSDLVVSLFRLLRPATTYDLVLMGWYLSGVGRHVQAAVGDGRQWLLLDGTVGLVAPMASLDALRAGAPLVGVRNRRNIHPASCGEGARPWQALPLRPSNMTTLVDTACFAPLSGVEFGHGRGVLDTRVSIRDRRLSILPAAVDRHGPTEDHLLLLRSGVRSFAITAAFPPYGDQFIVSVLDRDLRDWRYDAERGSWI